MFLSVRAAFPPEEAEAHLSTLSSVLQEANLPGYQEAFDIDAAEAKAAELLPLLRATKLKVPVDAMRGLGRLVTRARGEAAGPFRDLALRAEAIFVPGDFANKVRAHRMPGGAIWSTGALRAALRPAALTLGLPSSGGEVPESALPRIDQRKKLSKFDQVSDEEDEFGCTGLYHYRPAWLVLSEYCRLAHKHGLALVMLPPE
jgi:hypothetical protein